MEDLIQQAKVEPHWLPDGNSFWYRRNKPDSQTAFIIVDAVRRTRRYAFDHHALAASLCRIKSRTYDPESLPFDFIELNLDEPNVRFKLHDDVWQFGPHDNLQEWTGSFGEVQGAGGEPMGCSRISHDETTVIFANETDVALKVFWIDFDGKPIYYFTLPAGRKQSQDTFIGHVWKVEDAGTGANKGVFTSSGRDVFTTRGSLSCSEANPADENPNQNAADERHAAPGQEKVFVREHNLWRRNEAGEEHQITDHGKKKNSYDEEHVYVSSDAKFVIAWQYKPEQDRPLHLINSGRADQLEPSLKTIQYLRPGDRVRVDRPRLFDLDTNHEVPTEDNLFRNPYEIESIGWNKECTEYRFVYTERGHQRVNVLGIDRHGQVRILVNETSDTFICYNKMYFHVMHDTDELVWMSERDGWNHLYLYDLGPGNLSSTQITSGEWVVKFVDHVDAAARQVYFTACGIVPGQDPYCTHLARINLDGSDLTILTEGDGSHTWQWSPRGRFFIDSWSRVDSAPVTVLRDGSTGELLLELERTSISSLPYSSSIALPERFSCPGRDGITLIHGIILRPTPFEPEVAYPVLDMIYSGPQQSRCPKQFSTLRPFRRWAERGYAVVVVDGMGTNWRSKAFHDVCHKNLKDGGIPDHIAFLKAAAATRPWMDLARVGIAGSSAGGQNAAAALIFHNDDGFFKAAVADAGCHDNRMDKLWWNEQWMGDPRANKVAYEASSNIEHAARLRGRLMLMVGAMDTNVDPSCTFRLAHALNEAEKEYELVLFPSGGHGSGTSVYALERQARFLGRVL